ncbi:MAG TPA: nuclear transport factor 2 family protein [Solirubrobacterales bacterium]|nr:nuclear transport factor 2 family protein [Solirubrobacterales bacterium]
MADSIAQYQSASEAGDIDGIMAALTPDVEVVSPISGRMVFRGSDDVRHLFAAVYGTLKGLRWTRTVGEGPNWFALGEAEVMGVRMTDAMAFELAPDGKIHRISPHLRPWLALSIFALVLGPKVARKPGVVKRALAG